MKTNYFKIKRIVRIGVIVLFVSAIVLIGFHNSSSSFCNIHPNVKSMLEYLSISDCYIKSVGDYTDISYELSSPEISDDEIQEYIESVKTEYAIENLTDAFVSEKFECDSVGEFNEVIESKLLEQKKVEMILSTRQRINEELLNRSTFDLNADIVAQYSLEVVNSYETDAYLYGMTLEEYCSNILEVSYDDFFELCYEEGENLIKTYLVIGVIAFNELDQTDTESATDEQDIYYTYQEIENQVYDMFIETDDNF